MKITIGINFEKFDLKYREIVLFSILRMEDILSSPLFFECLKEEISKSNNLEGELSEWRTATPEEIHSKLFPITLYLNTYYTMSNVIGYGLATNSRIWINTKYLAGYRINNPLHLMEIGSNLLHEHSHDCGFKHDYKRTKRRPNSVSYILNRAYESAYKKYYQIIQMEYIRTTPWYKRVWRKLWT